MSLSAVHMFCHDTKIVTAKAKKKSKKNDAHLTNHEVDHIFKLINNEEEQDNKTKEINHDREFMRYKSH